MLFVIIMQGQTELFEVISALYPAGRFSGLLHRRQQQSNQRGNDRNDDQKLDQREAFVRFVDVTSSHDTNLPLPELNRSRIRE